MLADGRPGPRPMAVLESVAPGGAAPPAVLIDRSLSALCVGPLEEMPVALLAAALPVAPPVAVTVVPAAPTVVAPPVLPAPPPVLAPPVIGVDSMEAIVELVLLEAVVPPEEDSL